jgi:Zn-dependent protease with chaperone function
MGSRAAETILHGTVATLVVMVLLRTQRIRAPQARLRYWLLALACPALLTPLFWLLAPGRSTEGFRDEWSLLSGSHFSALSCYGIRLGRVVGIIMALAGIGLFLRDFVPLALDLATGRAGALDSVAPPDVMSQAVAHTAAALAIAPPRLVVRATKHPVLFCRGMRRPTIVASTGLFEMLCSDELEASIAHEMAHLEQRDAVLGWSLLFLRAMFFFNPTVQLVARAAALQAERRADLGAARITGSAEPMVRSLRKMASFHGTSTPSIPSWLGFRLAGIEERCQALLADVSRDPDRTPSWVLPATVLGLGMILFLTVA